MTYAVDFCLDLGAAASGLALTATIETMAGAAVASGVTGITERPAGSGAYRWSYEFADDASYYVMFYAGSVFKAATSVSPSDAAVLPDSTDALADLRASLAALTKYVVTEIAAIKARTDRIPDKPAEVGSAMTLEVRLT